VAGWLPLGVNVRLSCRRRLASMSSRDANNRTLVCGDVSPQAWEACLSLVERATLALAHLALADGALADGALADGALADGALADPPHAPAEAAAPGYRLFWSGPSGLAFCDLSAGEHVVIGRHSSCDVQLFHPSVALRQAVLRAQPRDGGALELHALDLAAPLPFFVGPSLLPLRAFAASGPTVFRVATEIVVALPMAHCAARGERPEGSGARVIEADPSLAKPIDMARSALAVRTMVDSISRTIVRPFAAPMSVEIIAPARGPTWARLAMRGPGGRVVLELSRAQLESLVLIGRYPRCQRGELSPFSENVSRVHAGILAVGDTIEVLDLASTNGLGKPRARAVRVRSRASIQLGTREDRLDLELLGG